jgi:hypothetical protein
LIGPSLTLRVFVNADTNAPQPDDDFRRLADKPAAGMLRELWDFLRENRAWWLTPIVAVLLLISALVILGATGAAPLIYTLF